jgi:hypothetical protein
MDKIHPRLRAAFEQKELPGIEGLIAIFREYSIEFSRTTSMFVILDTLDESENQYFRRVLDLIQLNDSGIRVYATARENYEAEIDRYFQSRLLHVKIEAQVEDIKNYLTQELALRNTDPPDPGFEKEIVDVIADGSDGM